MLIELNGITSEKNYNLPSAQSQAKFELCPVSSAQFYIEFLCLNSQKIMK